MIPLPRKMCRDAYRLGEPRFDLRPLQLGMLKCPWRVALASMMLQRTRRSQADAVLQDMLQRWPHPGALAAAEGLEEVLRPCGLHLSRARRVRRFCAQWLGDFWDDMRDLCGVGVYVADCVGYFCFGCKDLESTDWVLHQAVRG